MTEYNTAHNRRISLLGITEDTFKKNAKPKRKRRGITFNEEDLIINPEDVDPSVGRFRNLIQTTVIPTKRMRMENAIGIPMTASTSADSIKHLNPAAFITHLYQGLPPSSSDGYKHHDNMDVELSVVTGTLGSKLDPAPDVMPTEDSKNIVHFQPNISGGSVLSMDDSGGGGSEDEPKKKKYAKEAWPGRKPLLSGL